MTPLKPIENTTRVRGVPSKRYPLNRVCAHPECNRTDVTAHHIFGRPKGPDSDSWFVEIEDHFRGGGGAIDISQETVEAEHFKIIPHVTGLCGHGTEGHHGDVEAHRGWIKYEDGEFVWYERVEIPGSMAAGDPPSAEWVRVGPLNPQPIPREGKPKRKKRAKSEGPVKVASFKAPNDDPEAAERLKDKAEQLCEKFNRHGHEIGKTVAVERALDYTLLNAGEEDF